MSAPKDPAARIADALERIADDLHEHTIELRRRVNVHHGRHEVLIEGLVQDLNMASPDEGVRQLPYRTLRVICEQVVGSLDVKGSR